MSRSLLFQPLLKNGRVQSCQCPRPPSKSVKPDRPGCVCFVGVYFFKAVSDLLSSLMCPISSWITSSRRFRPKFSGTASRIPK